MPSGKQDDNNPLSRRQRDRLQRETHRERRRRMDAAVARRRDQRSGSPLRVLTAFLAIMALLAGITAVFLQLGDDGGGRRIEASASASADQPPATAGDG